MKKLNRTEISKKELGQHKKLKSHCTVLTWDQTSRREELQNSKTRQKIYPHEVQMKKGTKKNRSEYKRRMWQSKELPYM